MSAKMNVQKHVIAGIFVVLYYASGEGNTIYTINSMGDFHVELQDKYILLVDNEENIPN